jgi:hypothetical protein
MTDAELIVASRTDPTRFRELYDRLADGLLGYFYVRVLDAEVAADLLAVRVTRSSMPRGTALDDEDGRWSRYQAGCAVLAGGAPADDPDAVVLELFVRE